jgi:hypothetical protein
MLPNKSEHSGRKRLSRLLDCTNNGILRPNESARKWQGRPSQGTPTPPGYRYLTHHLPRKVTLVRVNNSAIGRQVVMHETRGEKTLLFKHDDKVFRPRRLRKSMRMLQTVPAGSGIGRGSSSTLGVVSTLGGTRPGLGSRPGQKDLHLREDASTAPADVLAKLQQLLPHLPRPGKPPSLGPTKSLSEPTPRLSALTPLPPAPAHRRAAEGSEN